MLMAGCLRPSSSREYAYLLLVFDTLQVVNVTYGNSALCLYIKNIWNERENFGASYFTDFISDSKVPA